MLAARDAASRVLAEGTTDGGATWSALPVPPRWVALASLTCSAASCRGLARTRRASLVVRLRAGSSAWRSTALAGPARALACTPDGTCVVVGGAGGRPFLEARTSGRRALEPRLRYVPGDLLAVACGTRRCVAIGDTTLLDVPSSLMGG